MLSTFIKLPFVIKNFVLSFFEWLLYTGFNVYMKIKTSLKTMAKIENNLAEMFNKHNSMPQVKNISKIFYSTNNMKLELILIFIAIF